MEVNVEKLALLARIKLIPKEKEKLQKEFGAILDYVSKLKEADISGIGGGEIGGPTGLENITREDENPHNAGEFSKDLLKEGLPAGRQAPSVENNYVKVKHILKQ